MKQKQYSYSIAEKLKSKKLIDQLFAARKSFVLFPLRVFYGFPEEQQDFILKTGVGCSKRNFKRAVHRNRVKRLLRESWRINKNPLLTLLEHNKIQMSIFLHYADSTLPELSVLNEKMPLIIQKLEKIIHGQLQKNN